MLAQAEMDGDDGSGGYNTVGRDSTLAVDMDNDTTNAVQKDWVRSPHTYTS